MVYGKRQQSDNRGGEGTLVRRARTGDRSAFDSLAASFGASVRGFLGGRVAQASVDDVVQETFLAAWTGLPKYTPRPEATFGMWLYRIARHKAADWARSNARVQSRETAITPADEERIAAPSPALGVEEGAEIAALLATLTPEQRELIELHYAHGLTLAQIATEQGRNLSTVKYHFYRAQDALIKARTAREEANR